MDKICKTCNYSRSPDMPIAPKPKEKRNWCSNLQSKYKMKYHNPENSCDGGWAAIQEQDFEHMKKAGWVND